ncbi:MAG: class I SAM-dependent methyltransferase [Actinomycetes bacterium]|jgi:SAM-dependent methyltransferase
MSLIEAWDRQQELYIGGREARFDALLDAVDWHVERLATSEPVVVDLCCGPAAIGRRLLRRFPTARYIGVDIDPVLLELARRVTAEHPAAHLDIVECDVADPGWLERAPVGAVDVVCSSTALHWLSGSELDRTLAHAWRSLRPGGLLLNADHLGFDTLPAFTELARWVASRDAVAASVGGAPNWAQWWAAARTDETLRPLCERRDQVFPPPEPPAVADHDEGAAAAASIDRRPPLRGFVDAARRAGFGEVDTIWQRFDDRIVMAVKPEHGSR